ncbi:sodium ABC transporter ATP-binding protein [Paenibacillus oryzae]|uniref:Sodium ABC transporter ATP-binding protein n=1 Tax=Paenibacillus oryzae TaxID=1844972 RepID=A0A1A5Y9T1_9BACL|nr:ABC transporter ATP-binding protein [Paenibacillus oryzae]OBR62342.1 sodium ABC transporter ATP-binding protein [Paenibacillus oryzae]
MEPILDIKGLSKAYDGFQLKPFDLRLERGSIMGFIGPNGAGKSTTIRAIMNLVRKDGGDIKIFGLDHIRHEQKIKDKIGVVFDEGHFYEDLSLHDTMKFISRFYTQWDSSQFDHYVKQFQLPLKKKIKELSKGMKMKFSLAIALSHHAELLIMDEPTSGLDPLVRSELLDILMTVMQDEQKAILLSTHITSDLDKIADYITLLHNGSLLFTKPKDALADQYGVVKGDLRQLPLLQELCIGVKKNSYGFEALVDDRARVKRELGDAVLIEKPNLEEIMLFYTRRELHA